MEVEQTWKDYLIIKWFTTDGNTRKAFETVSAFAIGVAINVIAKGFADGFDPSSILNWSSLLMGFAGGLGIPAVQEDAINKSRMIFTYSNELYVRYRKENIDLIDKLSNREFRRWYIKKTNKEDLQDLKETTTENRIIEINDKIFDLETKLLTTKNKVKINEQVTQLQFELDDLYKNGADISHLNWKPIELDDVFGIDKPMNKVGKESLIDDSLDKHRKQNWISRFYMPILVVIMQGTSVAVISKNKENVIISTIAFLAILIYTWFRTYQKHMELQLLIRLAVEKTRNDHLKNADKLYESRKQDIVEETVLKDKPIKEEIILIGGKDNEF